MKFLFDVWLNLIGMNAKFTISSILISLLDLVWYLFMKKLAKYLRTGFTLISVLRVLFEASLLLSLVIKWHKSKNVFV